MMRQLRKLSVMGGLIVSKNQLMLKSLHVVLPPRKKGSNWAESNINRAQRMLRNEKMTQAGMALLPVEVLKKWEKSIKK